MNNINQQIIFSVKSLGFRVMIIISVFPLLPLSYSPILAVYPNLLGKTILKLVPVGPLTGSVLESAVI